MYAIRSYYAFQVILPERGGNCPDRPVSDQAADLRGKSFCDDGDGGSACKERPDLAARDRARSNHERLFATDPDKYWKIGVL